MKNLKSKISLIILLILFFMFCFTINIFAIDSWTFAEKGYNTLSGYTAEQFFNTEIGESNSTKRQMHAQTLCAHRGSYAGKGSYTRIRAVVHIDGKKGTGMAIRDSEKYSDKTANIDLGSEDVYARIAYIAAQAELKKSVNKVGVGNDEGANLYQFAYRYCYENGGFRNKVSTLTGVSLITDTGSVAANTLYQETTEYINNNCTLTENLVNKIKGRTPEAEVSVGMSCKALVIMTGAEYNQAINMICGKFVNTNIDVGVTKEVVSDHGIEVGGAANFNISVENRSPQPVTMDLTDTYDTNFYDFKSFTGHEVSASNSNGRITATITIPGNTTYNYVASFTAKNNVTPNTNYNNQVGISNFKVNGNSVKDITEDDNSDEDYYYVKDYDVEINKYIYSVGSTDHKTRASNKKPIVYAEDGDTIAYAIQVKNCGNESNQYGTVKNIKFTDTFPSELVNVEYWNGTDWIKNAYPTGWSKDGNTFTYSNSLSVNGTATLYIRGTLQKGNNTTVSNTATIIGFQNINNEIIYSSTVNFANYTPSSSSDQFTFKEYKASITKTTNVTYAEAGDTVTYTIDVTNNGSGDTYGNIKNIQLSEIFETAELQYVSHNSDVWGKNGNTFTYSGTINKGAKATLTISFKVLKVSKTNDTIINTARITDIHNKNNISIKDCMASGSVFEASSNITLKTYKVGITKTTNVTYSEPGDTVTYTIDVTNNGSGDTYGNIKNIQLSEIFETAELQYVSHNSDVWGKNGNTFTYSGTINKGAKATLTISFKVLKVSKTNDKITNSVSITDIQNKNGVSIKDYMASGSSLTDSADITLKIYKATITKTANVTYAEAGDTVTYTIDVTNSGSGDTYGNIKNIQLSEIFETAELQYVSHNSDVWGKNGNTFTYSGTINKGAKATLTISFKVLKVSKTNDKITNSVSITDIQNKNGVSIKDYMASGSSLTDSADITLKIYKASIAKTANKNYAEPGEEVIYAITVKNEGSGDLFGNIKNIQVKEDFKDDELTYKSYSGENWTQDPDNNNIFTYTGELTPGSTSKTLNIKFTVKKMSKTNVDVENKANITAVQNRHKIPVYEYLSDGRKVAASKKTTVKKYTANITKTIHKVYDAAGKERSDKTKVEIGDTIEYKIAVKNAGTNNDLDGKFNTIYVSDYFDNRYLEYDSIDGDNWTKESEQKTEKETKLILKYNNSKGLSINTETSAAYVKLKVITTVDGSLLGEDKDLTNTVKIESTDKVLNKENVNIRSVLNGDLDAQATIKLLSYKVKISKYVTKVYDGIYDAAHEREISGRNTLSNAEKYDSPVEVEQNDIVVYTVKIHNDGNTSLKNIKIQDYIPEGLTLAGGVSGLISINDLPAGEDYIETIPTVVVMKNLYLQNLENRVEIIAVENRNDVGLLNNNLIIYNEQSHKEYVRLKDLVVSGTVWVDENVNGLMDNAEEKMAGIKVNLHDVTNNKVTTTTTNADGYYSFNQDTKGIDKTTGRESNSWMIVGGRVVKGTNKNAQTGNYDGTSQLIQYYVEFEYDGLIYQSTEAYSGYNNININNGRIKNENYYYDSNATEFTTERENFNKKYEIIGNNKAYNKELNNSISIEYNKNGHVSTVNTNHNRVMTAQSFINTTNQTIECLWFGRDNTEIINVSTEYTGYINLGLTKRENIDLSITQDVYEVKTTVNGSEMTYEYNQNDATLGNANIDKAQETSVDGKYNSEVYMTGYKNDGSSLSPYEFRAYNADYNYKVSQYAIDTVKGYKGTESELNIETTFRMRVTNNDNYSDKDVYVGINEIAEYYDKGLMELELNADGTVKTFNIKTKDENGYLVNTPLNIVKAEYVRGNGSREEAILSTTSAYNEERTLEDYNTLYIRPKTANSIILAEEESVDILITFSVAKEEVGEELELILGDKKVIAEISAYSTYYKDGENYKVAGIVDSDSNPGNLSDTNGVSEYEDDTFKTGITMLLQDATKERNVKGFVWDDTRDDNVGDVNGIQFTGDGIYYEADRAIEVAQTNEAVKYEGKRDIPIKDMKVELVEQIAIPEDGKIKVYEETIKTDATNSVMTVRTGADGTYTLKGYIPGNYIVKFYYGDDASKENMLIYNGQDYKSTKYQCDTIYGAIYADSVDDPDTVLDILEASNISDAKDDEITRLENIAYSETMTNNINEILRGKDSSNKEALVANTKMKAETAEFKVKTEKENEGKTRLTYAEAMSKFATEERFPINNIDFGIEYRPELQISLKQYISNIEIRTSDSNKEKETTPLVSAKFNEYYGIVVRTDIHSGATEFLTGADGEIIKVDRNASKTEIETAVSKAGGNIENAQIPEVEGYIVALAGTELDEEASIGLTNLQYVENVYDKDINGNLFLYDSNGYIKATQGFAYINVDDEIMQGATILIKYIYAANNLSEIDRVSSNLSELRFKENEAVEAYKVEGKYYDQVKLQLGEETGYIDLVYSGARTARNKLFSEYYEYELKDGQINKDAKGKDIIYKIKEKVISRDSFNGVLTSEDGYYGRYLGSTYYTGVVGAKDVVSELKIDKILNYIDNDLVFDNSENNGKNNLWKTMTSRELKESGLITAGAFTNGLLLDKDKRAYDTAERSNLAILLDDRIKDYDNEADDTTVNKDISKYLMPRYSEGTESFGTVSIVASKIISAEDASEDMTYENIGEILQYSSVTGRVTCLGTTIGNVDFSNTTEWEEARKESDTAGTEKVMMTPPTGLEKVEQVVRNTVEGASYIVIVIIAASIVCVAVLGGIKLYRNRRIK